MGTIYFPFGLYVIDDTHQEYLKQRDSARSSKCNENSPLFNGTRSTPYVHGFSNHAYTFAFYLFECFPLEEGGLDLCLVIEFFYFEYINKGFHSFGEIDAAFLRALENVTLRAPQNTNLNEKISNTINAQLPRWCGCVFFRSHHNLDEIASRLSQSTRGIMQQAVENAYNANISSRVRSATTPEAVIGILRQAERSRLDQEEQPEHRIN